jgi:hypothetical protein
MIRWQTTGAILILSRFTHNPGPDIALAVCDSRHKWKRHKCQIGASPANITPAIIFLMLGMSWSFP